MYSARTAASTYATEALSAEMKAELVRIILYRKMSGTMRESRTLVRSVNACQRAEAALLLVEVATSALDEIAEGDVPQGNGAGNEMELLLEIQERDRKMLEMNARCEEAEALRQEAENAVLKMSARCEEAEKLRTECVHMLELGAEKDESLDRLREEIARMQEERVAADAGNLEENLRKEIVDLQAKYEQACESASELQSRLESIQEIHKLVGCLVTATDVDRGTMTLDCTVARRLQSTIKECVSLHPQTIREEIGMQHYQPPGCGLGTTRTIHRHFVRSAPQDATKTRLPICSAPNAHPTQRRTTAALCSARRARRARRRTGAPGRWSVSVILARSRARTES